MSEINQPITFCQLLEECPRIEVPLIQRDYAQGREAEKEVRDDFLKALYGALLLRPDDSSLPLNLDFLYGSIEGGDSKTFLPLDGQQRLTTLFLLHWYLAWRDERSADFQRLVWHEGHSRFTYAVRPSSTEFFDELAHYVPETLPDTLLSLRKEFENQPWFFLHWRLDPTIQSALMMMEAIHERFRSTQGLFARLLDCTTPAITFQMLPLEHFGLTDDLYIKMNARGKPLTPLETFKARFEGLLDELYPDEKRSIGDTEVEVAEFFERRFDTKWTDLFWAYKNPATNTFDDAFMKLLLVVARVSLDPEGKAFNEDTTFLRTKQLSGSFSVFHERGWLNRRFADNLICLLEVWSRGENKLSAALSNNPHFNEELFFKQAIQDPAGVDYAQLIQFAAFVFYFRHHEGRFEVTALSEWTRVVRNLAANSEIERPEDFGRCLAGLTKLLPGSADILNHLASVEIGQLGFSPQQIREEILKAKLLTSNAGWCERVNDAESHGYFVGQIEFLLDFSGVVSHAEQAKIEQWDAPTHERLQKSFVEYWRKAKITFDQLGLKDTSILHGVHLWKRALLSVGDYMASIGSNYSFLTNPPRNGDSWKRYLRSGFSGKRSHLKTLWDMLDIEAKIEPQLNQLIDDAQDVEPWRTAIIKNPEVISYCGNQEIRWKDDTQEIYLLKKRQMNGTHAELFSYVLYLELSKGAFNRDFEPLRLLAYQSVSMTEIEPHVLLVLDRSGSQLRFAVESVNGQFRIRARSTVWSAFPGGESVLREQAGFSRDVAEMIRVVSRNDILQTLLQLSQLLKILPIA